MTQVNIVLTALGLLALALGALATEIKRSWVSGPMLATLVGVLLGPMGFRLVLPSGWGPALPLLEQVARITVAFGVMGIALRVPTAFLRGHIPSIALLLGPVMVLMWVASAALAGGLLPVGVLEALLIGAVVTPTDPVLASSVVSGGFARRHIPAKMRHLLSAESGANDGLAYPFVLLGILLLNRGVGVDTLGHWTARVLLYEVLGAVVLGGALGWVAARALQWGKERGQVEETSFLAYSIALTLSTLGVMKLVGVDGILAVAASGVTFAATLRERNRHREENVQEAVNAFLILPCFLLFGALLPWRQWGDLGPAGLVFAASILLLRRPPFLLGLSRWLPEARGRRSGQPRAARERAAFLGWFGPVGAAALYYATYAHRHTGSEWVWPAASLVIFASVVVHGATAGPLTVRLGRAEGGT